MTATLNPAGTLDAIAVHRASVEDRRTRLLAERRSLAPRVVLSDPAALQRVTQIANEMRDDDATLDDLLDVERQALDAIEAENNVEKERWKVATITAIGKALKKRDELADGIEAKLSGLLADLREFDDLSGDIQRHANLYGRVETVGFLTPPLSDEILFQRLTSLHALPAVATNGRIIFNATIATTSRECGERLWAHLVELLPPEKRPSAVVAQGAPKKDKRKAKAAPVQEHDESFVDEFPLEEI